jgi:hypothetical protein
MEPGLAIVLILGIGWIVSVDRIIGLICRLYGLEGYCDGCRL